MQIGAALSREHPDLPILWRCALLYTTKSEAVADAKRRVDEVLENGAWSRMGPGFFSEVGMTIRARPQVVVAWLVIGMGLILLLTILT